MSEKFFSIFLRLAKREYKKEIIFFYSALIFFTLSVLFLLTEVKQYIILNSSYRKLDENVHQTQIQIARFRERLQHFLRDLSHKELRWERVEMRLDLDLRNLKACIEQVRSVTAGDEESYFVFNKMVLENDKDGIPYLRITGELFIFR